MFGKLDVGKVPIPLGALCLVLAGAHAGLAGLSRDIHASAPVLSPPPGEFSRKALAFGDDQFLYRRFAIDLQNAGDGAGQVTPISKYNYDYVIGWLRALAELDSKANHHFVLAGRYFSFTRNNADLRRVIEFMVEKASADPQRHWIWLTRCIELADHHLGDSEYALVIARAVAGYDFPDMQPWIWMFPALLLEKLGRFAEGYEAIEKVRAEKLKRLSDEEINWLNEVSQRLKRKSE